MTYKLIINFKTYEESLCENAQALLSSIKEVEQEALKKNVELIACPSLLDIKDSVRTGVTTYSQHIDDYNVGAHTGFVLPHSVACAGAKGSLLNHSEHRIDFEDVKKNIEILQELNLESCVCVENTQEIKKITHLKPSCIAVEPPELIGGDISISTAQPELIKLSVESAGDIPLLVGAGVKNSQDVKKAVELGAKGILVASGVVKAKNPREALLDLLNGFSN